MRIKPFKALYPDMNLVPNADPFFEVMKQEFPQYLKNSFFERTSLPGFFLYEIKGHSYNATGLIASTSVKDIQENKILKHENTLAKKEQQMLDLALQRNAMIKPVLLAHPNIPDLDKIYDEIKQSKAFLEIPFKEEKSIHRVWHITDKKYIDSIHKLFAKEINKSYIADGHHRVSTGILLNGARKNTKAQFGDLLSIYFSFENLKIYDYNRVVSILKEISPTKLMVKISKYMDMKPLKELRKPKKKHEIVMAIAGESFSLKWKKKYLIEKEAPDHIVLDARLLNTFIFRRIMKMKDIRNDTRITYTGGNEGVEGIRQQLLRDDYAVGFLLYPITEQELRKVADKGSTLPPKSTWFEPRIKNAIISQEFE